MHHENPDEGYFCARPFTHAVIHGDATLRSCPVSWVDHDMGSIAQSDAGMLWNSSAAQDLRRSILDGTYKHCRALSCPYLAPGGPSLPRCEEVTALLQRRALREALVVLPWGPEVVEVDLRDMARAGAIAEILNPSDLLKDATTVVLLMTPDALENARVVEALQGLPIATMLSLRVAVDFPVHAFSVEHWHRLTAALGTVHELRLRVAEERSFEYDQDQGLLCARNLRRAKKVPRLALRCPLHLSELHRIDRLLTRRSALNLDHIELIPAEEMGSNRSIGLDEALRDQIRSLGAAPWRQDPAIVLGPLHSLLVAVDIDPHWKDWATAMGLDEAQQAVILNLVNALKETVAELFDETPADGSPSPIAYLQALERNEPEEATRQVAFERYIAEKKIAAGTQSFRDARLTMEAACRKKIAALLNAGQRDAFRSLGGRSLLDLETGFAPLRQRVHRNATRGIPFEVWASKLDLTPTAQRDALAAIHGWRDAFTRIMTTLPETKTESPAALLARLAMTDPDRAQGAFIAYARATPMPGKQQSYFLAAEQAKQQCLQKLLPLVGRASSPGELLADLDRLDTGYDPFGAWIDHAQHEFETLPAPRKRP